MKARITPSLIIILSLCFFGCDSIKPQADFKTNLTSGPAPLSVNFTDQSVSESQIIAWQWNFGDGQISQEVNPSHTYDQLGQYTVSLTVVDQNNKSDTTTKENLISVYQLDPDQLYGFYFGPYTDQLQPGDPLDQAQIKQSLNLIKPHCRSISFYANEKIIEAVEDLGFEEITIMSWLGPNEAENKQALDYLTALTYSSVPDVLVVGSEVIFRGDLPVSKLIEHIQAIRKAIRDNAAKEMTVAYADSFNTWIENPELIEAVDKIYLVIQPSWSVELNQAVDFVLDLTQQLQLLTTKEIIVETGWPSDDGLDQACQYLAEFRAKAQTKYYWFSAFDEPWRGRDWGIIGKCL